MSLQFSQKNFGSYLSQIFSFIILLCSLQILKICVSKIDENNNSENNNEIKNEKSITNIGMLDNDDIYKSSLHMSILKSFENFSKDSIKFMGNYRESSSSFLGQSSIQKSIGMEASNAGNINQLYSNLLKEYEKINNSYNELLN